jgi:starch-binding outer membrane protein, SusD/RagB family
MRNFLNILKIAFIIGILASCSKDYVNLTPLGSYSDAAVWKDPNLVETFVNNMYRNALGFPFSIERLSDYVDESNFTPDWSVSDFNKSLITSDDLLGWQVGWATPHTLHYRWAPLFSNVRNANIFFSKINGVPASDAATKDKLSRMKGEAFFLRAYTYHYLVALYGGVPIITKPFGLSDSFDVPRNTYEECINFITADFDSAANLLPESYADLTLRGRATKGAALAMKARTLLYAASDLHANQSTYASGFAHPELLGYVGGDRAARWTAAKNAAKAVMDMGTYGLYKAVPAATDSVAKNISDYFISYGYENEDILLQYFTPKTDEDWDGYNPALYCGPNGYHNWGNNCPLGELVDDYEMKDGTAFDWSNVTEQAAPYSNREARFYATILYEGSHWRKRPTDVQSIDPWDRLEVGAVFDATGTNVIVPGVDTRSGPIEDWNGGYTGYYTRKFVDPSLDPQYVKQDIPFRHIRFAEVLLDYAEACNETGDDANALININLISPRAGQPPINLSGAALKDAYRHERRIELVYEDHRFWDVRRWVIGPAAYHQMHSVSVKYMTSGTPTTYRQADGSTWGPATYASIEAAKPMETRAWLDKAYFFPIMRDELNKNTKLIQNPGY